MTTFEIKKALIDIRFWIVLFFIVRLFGITNPPLEVAHNWRQTTVTMAARNFIETDANIFYPRIDIAGEKTGITAMEFPFLNYLIYLVSLVFGYAHWYGRLINLLVSSIGIYFFYKLIKKYFNLTIAFNAAFMLLLSVWYTYSRKIMPDTFSMSLFIVGYYYGANFLDKQNSFKNLMLFFVFTLVGILSKLPNGYLLSTFVLFMLQKQITLNRKLIFFVAGVLIMCIVSAYYFYWVPYLTTQYGFTHFFMGKSFSEGISETLNNLNEVFDKFYEEALGYTGFVLFIIGLIFLFLKKNSSIIAIFAVALCGFLIIIFKSGFAFYQHSYYIIPFAPIMALVSAFVFEHTTKKTTIIVLCLFVTEAILSKNHDFHIKEQNKQLLTLEKTVNEFSNSNDLFLINSGNVPTPMYFAHRKGWVDYNENITNTRYIDSLKLRGLAHIVILKRAFGTEIELPYPKIFNNNDYCIYKLNNK